MLGFTLHSSFCLYFLIFLAFPITPPLARMRKFVSGAFGPFLLTQFSCTALICGMFPSWMCPLATFYVARCCHFINRCGGIILSLIEKCSPPRELRHNSITFLCLLLCSCIKITFTLSMQQQSWRAGREALWQFKCLLKKSSFDDALSLILKRISPGDDE